METGTNYIRVEKARGGPEQYTVQLPGGYARITVGRNGTAGVLMHGYMHATVTVTAANARYRVLRACVGRLQERGYFRDAPAYNAVLAALETAYAALLVSGSPTVSVR